MSTNPQQQLTQDLAALERLAHAMLIAAAHPGCYPSDADMARADAARMLRVVSAVRASGITDPHLVAVVRLCSPDIEHGMASVHIDDMGRIPTWRATVGVCVAGIFGLRQWMKGKGARQGGTPEAISQLAGELLAEAQRPGVASTVEVKR